MLSWLRDFTDLPLGVYPNLGYLSAAGWRHEAGVGADEYAELALRWREEGAQIVGGCCGVGPEHIAAARAALADTKPGHARPAALPGAVRPGRRASRSSPTTPRLGAALDRRARAAMFPLDFPDITVEPGVFVPTQGSLTWSGSTCYREAHRRSPALPGHRLRHRPADRPARAQRRRACARARHRPTAAVKNTLTNAFRNGVADRVSAAVQDLYPWVPEERYDVIVASLYQTAGRPVRAGRHRTARSTTGAAA